MICIIDTFIANNKINNSIDHAIGDITNSLTFTDATLLDMKYIKKLYKFSKYLTKLLGKRILSEEIQKKILIDSNDLTFVDLFSLILYLIYKSKLKQKKYIIKKFEHYFKKVVVIYKQSEFKLKSNKSLHFGLSTIYNINPNQVDLYQAYNLMDL
jgi:hypothetical protein